MCCMRLRREPIRVPTACIGISARWCPVGVGVCPVPRAPAGRKVEAGIVRQVAGPVSHALCCEQVVPSGRRQQPGDSGHRGVKLQVTGWPSGLCVQPLGSRSPCESSAPGTQVPVSPRMPAPLHPAETQDVIRSRGRRSVASVTTAGTPRQQDAGGTSFGGPVNVPLETVSLQCA